MLTNRLRSYRIFADDTPMCLVAERLQPVPVAVYGITGAGKSYFMSAFCNKRAVSTTAANMSITVT